jgi:DNA helicase-2/ATP-dependent DNA helicase PcrA
MLKSSAAFDEAYKNLNPEQRTAVDTLEGPVMVIAGPGTGKTQVLATRIANILLKTDTNPYAILALTFTESAAKNMRERLVQLIGPTAYSVNVQTFHAFCDEVIQSYPEYFSVSRNSQVLTDLERYELMEELLKNPQLKVLRPINSPYHYLKTIIKTLSDLKREGVNEVRFSELVIQEKEAFEADKSELKKTELTKREKALVKMEELSLIYTQYQQNLRSRDRYDYDDMITFVVDAFQREETLLLNYQERLTYFLVDEYQDTNASQNVVVDLLASYWGENANIFVVGDPHQSIYRFQGASLENTLNFVLRYPTATVVSLATGYRSPQVIYDAASEVIQNNQKEDVAVELPKQQFLKTLARPLKSIKPDGQPIRVYKAPSAPLEVVYVAEEIRQLMAEGIDPAEIAILYRNNAESTDLQIALDKWNIPFHVDSGNDILQDEVIRQFLTLCRVIIDIRTSREGHELFEVMNYPWLGLHRLLVMKVARAASQTKMSMYNRIIKGFVEFCKVEYCEDVTAADFTQLEDFITKLTLWGQRDAELTFPSWFEMVINESGFLNWLISQPTKIVLLHHLNALFREIKALAQQDHTLNLEKFMSAIATMQEHGIQIAAEEVRISEHAVTLSTAHKAKGQEWEYVFLTGCIDGKWGNSRKPSGIALPEGILTHTSTEEQDRNEDDRRLFYVSITRAKKQLTITHPESLVTGNRAKLALPSMFTEEVDAKHKVIVEQPESEKNAEEHLARLLQAQPVKDYSELERSWLQGVVKDFKLSVTALNLYLRSPELFVEEILLRVPRTKPGYQSFGTAVHFALEYLYKEVQKNGQPPAVKMVLEKFEECLAQEILTNEEFELRLAYGKKILKQYYEQYAHEPIMPVLIERFFGYGWSKAMLGDISLVGRVDRIDWLDKTANTVTVVDYKTGKSRTVNEIEGKVSTAEFSERELALPENIRGPYKRQLLFYKLLTQLDPTFKATVKQGLFDFVQPEESGKFVQRRFELLDADVDALKELIVVVMKEIRNLDFLVQQ